MTDSVYAECARAARTMVDAEFLAELKKPRPRVVYGATALIWLQLVVSWAIALWGPLWLLWLPVLINAGATQGMLLWVHEASHFSLFPDRRKNDIWTDVFLAGPIGMTAAAYRAKHMTHHAHLGSDKDEDSYPYLEPIKGTRALLKLLVRVASGSIGLWLAMSKYVTGVGSGSPAKSVAPRWLGPLVTLVFNLGLLGLCVYVGRWWVYFAVWVYPILAIAILLNVIRTIAEHQPEDFPRYEDGRETSMRPVARTTVPNPFEKWLMYQANFNYHVEHHLFPAIPQHNLRVLHERLVSRGFYQQFPSSLQRSGFRKFLELAQNRTHDDFTDPVHDAILS